MSERLIILGGGGHGKVVADIARKLGYREIAFLDDTHIGTVMGYPVLGGIADAEQFLDGNTEYVIAIGGNATRKRIAQCHDLPWATLIHPTAVIGTQADIGTGTVVMANAVVNPCARIGAHCILNTACVVEHDNVIGDYTHISPRAALAGTVTIGEGTHVGIGATVKNNVTICGGCTIGAGAVVVKQIEESGTYVGVPARKIK